MDRDTASGLQSRLSPELLAQLAAQGGTRSFEKGETLFHEGETADALYILLSGRLKVFTRDRSGRELIYNTLGPGEFLGELLLDGGVRSASVRAATRAECVVVRGRELRRFLRAYPEFSEAVIVKLIARLRHATQQTRSLALDGVSARVTALLNQEALLESGVRIVPKTFTQQEIADRIGATREMVNHVLRDLTKRGFLGKDPLRRLVIAKKLPAPR